MRCKRAKIFSTKMFNFLNCELATIENLFPTINISFVISITIVTTTYSITKAVINNEIVTSHRQTIFIIEDCELFIVSTLNKKNVSVLILNSPGSFRWIFISFQLKMKQKLSNTAAAIINGCWRQRRRRIE